MGMEIHGPNMGRYDAGYLTAVQREMARSVKPNVLRELGDIEEQITKAFYSNIEDLVDLSPDAKEYLKKLRKRLEKDRDNKNNYQQPEEPDFQSLLQGLDDFRRSAQDEAAQELDTPKNFLFPTTIALSGVPRSGPSPKRRGYSPVRETINRMTYSAPTDKARELVQDELEVMGFEVVSQVRSFGTHIIVLERNRALTDLRIKNMMIVAPSERTFDGRPWGMVRGIYDSSRRLFVIGEEQLGRPDHSVARHEFAHAFDHAYSEKHGRKLPLSVQLWNLFRSSRTANITAYASTNPAEYFAESVEAFFNTRLRPQLQQQDPQMFTYLEEMFKGA